MLVLKRRIGEEIVVGQDVSIRVLAVNGNRVRLGIKAPRAVEVHREEVLRGVDLSRQAFDRQSASQLGDLKPA